MKLPLFLTAARSRWLTQTPDATPVQRQAGEQALALVAEAYAQTPAYNYQLQLGELRARLRHLEADLATERTASLKLRRQLNQQDFTPTRQFRAQLEQERAAELRRLQHWVAISENTSRFALERLTNLQTEILRRINRLERASLFWARQCSEL